MTELRNDIRNIAIIAHVDHGKTTLVDGMLQQTHVFREGASLEDRVLDSNALEKERGITILSKNTAVTYGDTKINIVDTPGHADFGGEVERVLNMVDGALLLVDAVEGPMPQTRFVLRKALELGLRIIVVVNKVDRQNARITEVMNETFDLFIELGATDEQADFPVVYAIGLHGKAGYTADTLADTLEPMFDIIVKEVPPPTVEMDAPAKMLVTTLEYDRYKGQIAIGRMVAGTMTQGMPLVRITSDGKRVSGRLDYLFQFHNLEKTEVESASAGDIVALAGFDPVEISDTIGHPDVVDALPSIKVEEPTVRMTFGINSSPFSGQDADSGMNTSRKLRARLYQEIRSNVALRVEEGETPDKFVVSGRGELHLGILIETMRREGYEFEVSKPEVIYIEDPETGKMLEPVEEVYIEVADDYVGTIMEMMGERRALMTNMRTEHGTTYLDYMVPTRGLLGFRAYFMRATSGMGQMHSLFHAHEPISGEVPGRGFGSLVAMEQGTSTTYSIVNMQARGIFFIEPGTDVYEGMVIGENTRDEDLAINIVKAKHLDNFRAKPKEVSASLVPPRNMSLDDYLEYLGNDELLEVTPKNLRIRKRILKTDIRMKEAKKKRLMIEG
ncbi:MAG: translational GTPase TypA [Phototrophicaceae bacterium]